MIRLLIQNELLPLSKARTVFRRSLDYAFIPEGCGMTIIRSGCLLSRSLKTL